MLRQHTQIGNFSHTTAALRLFGQRHALFLPFSLFVLFLRCQKPIFYRGIQNLGLLTGTPCWPPRLRIWPWGLVKFVPRASRRNFWASWGPLRSKNCQLTTAQTFALTYWCADQGRCRCLHLKFLGFNSETRNMALVLHTLDCAKWMPWDHDMHHCAKSRGNAVVCGKQLPALVLWSHIWDHFEQYVTPRAIARERSKIIV